LLLFSTSAASANKPCNNRLVVERRTSVNSTSSATATKAK